MGAKERALFKVIAFLLLSIGISSAAAGEHGFFRRVVDAERGRVWVLTSDGVQIESLKNGRVLGRVRLPGWTVAGEPHGCAPGLAVDEWGDAVVTSDVLPTLWKVHAATFAASRHELAVDTDRDVGFSALGYSHVHGAFLAVSFHHGTLWRIDRQLRRAEKIALSQPLIGACQLIVRPDRVCVYTPLEWTVELSRDLRSATARRGSCSEETVGMPPDAAGRRASPPQRSR